MNHAQEIWRSKYLKRYIIAVFMRGHPFRAKGVLLYIVAGKAPETCLNAGSTAPLEKRIL